ncbi:MAG: hypothetical protein ACLU00_00815 [Mediterraneibacter faecis]
MNQIVAHLIKAYSSSAVIHHLFSIQNAIPPRVFGDLGFYEIARIDGQDCIYGEQKNRILRLSGTFKERKRTVRGLRSEFHR